MANSTPIRIQLKTPRLGAGFERELKSKDLGFGKIFSDHMACVNYTRKDGWNDARVIPYGPLSMDPGAAVFHYGQAMFEGLKAFRGSDNKIRLFRPLFHCERLAAGSDRLCMPRIPSDMLNSVIQEFVKVEAAWVPKERGSSLYLRPTLIATEPFLGVRPSDHYLLFVIGSPVGSYYAEGANPVKIWVESNYSRAAKGGLGAIKAGANYASSLLASADAKKQGYAQVLWLDAAEHKFVEEVGTMNVFFVFKNEIVTPPLGGTILNGATRDSSLTLMKSWGLNVVERMITMDEVVRGISSGELREAFGTGTAAVISPIGEFSYQGRKHELKPGAGETLSQKLYQSITAIQYGEAPDEFGWMTEVR